MMYSELTDSDGIYSNSETNDFSDGIKKQKKIFSPSIASISKKKPKKETKIIKKMITENCSSYKNTLNSIISSGKFENSATVNTVSIKQNDQTYTFKSGSSIGEDYWVVQHFKTQNISNVAPQDRWKHAEASVKLTTSSKNEKDKKIVAKLHSVLEDILEKFNTDPKSKMTSCKNKP